MGGDRGLATNVEGALWAARDDGSRVVLVGDEAAITAEVQKQGGDKMVASGRVAIRHATEVVAMDEKPAVAVRKKKNSSMRIACDLVKQGEACAAFSTGNSGAMMAVALLVFSRVRGVSRPCIATPFPHPGPGRVGLVVDAGANTECDPQQLLQFGLMGECFSRRMYDITKPTIGVLSNGTEDSKGTDLTRGALELFRGFCAAEGTDNFLGHVEAGDCAAGRVSVLVTDGFTGNISLKMMESAAKSVVNQIREGYERAGILGKLGGLLSKSVFADLKARTDPREFGAAPLLGLRFPGYIGHGSSDAYAIRKGIVTCGSDRSLSIAADIERAVDRAKQIFEETPNEAASA